MKRYWMETYGCQMNVRDSEIIAGVLKKRGWVAADAREDAEMILFNTCCVRDHAEKRVFGNIGMLREWKEARPDRIVGVSGCMMQQEGVAEKLMKRFPFVNLAFGTHMLCHLDALLDAVEAGERVTAVSRDVPAVLEGLPSVRKDGASAFVNINYGCNNYCTYCIVPYVRGPERSRLPENVVAEVRALSESGRTEITLLGQNVNSYGKDLGGIDFSDLLTQTSDVPGIRRIRFMTSHPKDLSEKLIDTMARLPKVCHHVHLPLQSGSDRILERMNRHYTAEKYLSTVEKLRAAMPDVELTTDIIVGFPGESEEDFLETEALVENVGFATAFTFKYSPRKGTPAAGMEEQIPDAVKRARLMRLNALQAGQTQRNNEKYVGFCGEVLVEGTDGKRSDMLYGKYKNFKMVYFPGNADLIGSYVHVRAERVRGNSLAGTMERIERI